MLVNYKQKNSLKLIFSMLNNNIQLINNKIDIVMCLVMCLFRNMLGKKILKEFNSKILEITLIIIMRKVFLKSLLMFLINILVLTEHLR